MHFLFLTKMLGLPYITFCLADGHFHFLNYAFVWEVTLRYILKDEMDVHL